MRFYAKGECEDWLQGRKRAKPDCIPEIHRAHVHHPTSPGRILYLAHWIAGSLMYRDPALVWITEWGIWGSSENWHLYYKLRQTYGDPRLLHEAPGHLFLGHESEDLASFLQLAMLNGWGGYVLTQVDYVNAFLVTMSTSTSSLCSMKTLKGFGKNSAQPSVRKSLTFSNVAKNRLIDSETPRVSPVRMLE